MSYSKVLIDSATIHSTAALYYRIGSNLRIRPINILSLSSLIDAFVLFESIIVDKPIWDQCLKYLPDEWLVYLNKVVDEQDLSLPIFSEGLENFLSSEVVFWILNSLIKSEINLGIRDSYMTYVGTDFGMSYKDIDDLFKIDSILKNVWDWDYHHSNADHIDVIHASWRALQYSEYCTKNDFSYFPHELRGRFFDAISCLYGLSQKESFVEDIMKKLKNEILKDHLNNLKNNKGFIRPKEGDVLFWQQFKLPLLSAWVFQRSNNIYDIFYWANVLRKKAKSLREKCLLVDVSKSDDTLYKIDKLRHEFEALFNLFEKGEQPQTLDWVIQGNFPWGIALGLGSSKIKGRHLTFVRDIYNAKSIPLTLNNDIKRIFNNDMEHWNWKNKS